MLLESWSALEIIVGFVVACTDRGTLQRYATQRRDYFPADRQMPQEKAPHLPYSDFRLSEIQAAFDKMVISHKPDHGNAREAIKKGKTVARLHEETYYGMAGEGDKKGTWKLIQRIPVSEIKKLSDLDVLIDQAGTANPIRAILAQKDPNEHEAAIQKYFEAVFCFRIILTNV